MTYPKEDDPRYGLLFQEYLKVGIDEVRKNRGFTPRDRSKVNEFDLALLNNIAVRGRDKIQLEAAERMAAGSVTGFILRLALQCGIWAPKHRSLRNVIRAVSEAARTAHWDFAMSSGQIEKYWTEFRSVAHLHAAAIISEVHGEDWMEQQSFDAFLSIARTLAKMAACQRPPVGRTSSKDSDDGRVLLDPKIVWNIPDELDRSEEDKVTDLVKQALNKPSDEMLSILECPQRIKKNRPNSK